MWKEEGSAAVITWDSGWVTKITKEGDSYKKTAEKDGKPVGSPSDVEKGRVAIQLQSRRSSHLSLKFGWAKPALERLTVVSALLCTDEPILGQPFLHLGLTEAVRRRPQFSSTRVKALLHISGA